MAHKDGCRGKVKHKSKWNAIGALKRLDNAGLSIYHCGVCKSWHLGNSRYKIDKRLDQLIEQYKVKHG